MGLSKEVPGIDFSMCKERREWMNKLRKDEKAGQLRDSRILSGFPISAPCSKRQGRLEGWRKGWSMYATALGGFARAMLLKCNVHTNHLGSR